MLWETKVDELQRYGKVLLHRQGARWIAVWEVLVAPDDSPYVHWPSAEGYTPQEAVNRLWEHWPGSGRQLVFVQQEPIRAKWNGCWKEGVDAAKTA